MTESERKTLNAKLHALSYVICGSDEVLRSMLMLTRFSDQRQMELVNAIQISNRSQISTTDLTDAEAEEIHKELKSFISKQNKFKKAVLSNTGVVAPLPIGTMTPGQRAAIIKITKYIFKWSPDATFSYILETAPDARKYLSSFEIKKSSLSKLFSVLNKYNADKIIKRLDKIKKHNLKTSNGKN